MQGMEPLPTSQMPLEEPPQGPFISCLAQRLTGHRPPKSPMMQLPQAWQNSFQTPCSTAPPMQVVLIPGKTGTKGYRAATYCGPTLQAMETTASASFTRSSKASIYSGSHCRSQVYSNVS